MPGIKKIKMGMKPPMPKVGGPLVGQNPMRKMKTRMGGLGPTKMGTGLPTMQKAKKQYKI